MTVIYSLTFQRTLNIIPVKFFLPDYYIIFILSGGNLSTSAYFIGNFYSYIIYIFRVLFCWCLGKGLSSPVVLRWLPHASQGSPLRTRPPVCGSVPTPQWLQILLIQWLSQRGTSILLLQKKTKYGNHVASQWLAETFLSFFFTFYKPRSFIMSCF